MYVCKYVRMYESMYISIGLCIYVLHTYVITCLITYILNIYANCKSIYTYICELPYLKLNIELN